MKTTIDLTLAAYPDLSDRRIVIAGGTGGVGEGVVRAWLRVGAAVVVLSRSERRADQFADLLGSESVEGRLSFAVGDYTTFDGAEQLAQRVVAEHGEVTDAIASIGGWWQRVPLWQVAQAEWDRHFVQLATAHVANVRAWLPRMSNAGAYQLILGGSATRPVPGASIVNMEQAALLMMRSVVSAEAGDQRRIVSHILGPVDTRQRNWVDPEWVSAVEVGLLTTGVAASSEASGVDFDRHTKEQLLRAAREPRVYPEADAR